MSNRNGSLRLAFVLEAIDKATSTVAKVNARIDKLTEPARRVRAAFKDLFEESRFSRIGDAAELVGKRWQALTGLVSEITRVAAAATLAVGGLFMGFKRMADGTDRLSDTAKMLGVTTQELQRLGYAAQMSGSSTEEMGDALRFLSRAKADALSGNKEMAQWFERVGISAQQLKKASLTEVLGKIGDTFNRVGDDGSNAAKKVAVTMALLGRSGASMKQTLENGSEGLKKLGDEADRLGIVLQDKTIESMGDFNDSWDRLRMTLFGATANALGAVAPVLQGILQRITDWTAANRALIATRFGEWVEVLSERLPKIWEALSKAATWAGRFMEAADKVAQSVGGWETVFAALLGLIGARMVMAIGGLVTAIWGLNAAMLANPIVAVTTALAALVALLPVAITRYRQLREEWAVKPPEHFDRTGRTWFWGQLFGGDKAPSAGASADAATAPAPSAMAASQAQVGGTLKITIDQDGKPRVSELKKTPGSGMDLQVDYTGASMAFMGS